MGQNQWEEVNVQPAHSAGGENYGWPIMEGTHCFQADTCQQDGLTLPVAEYSHTLGCSVTGGYVYRHSPPALQGIYFYGDYCSGRIWGLVQVNGQWQNVELLSSGVQIEFLRRDRGRRSAGHRLQRQSRSACQRKQVTCTARNV